MSLEEVNFRVDAIGYESNTTRTENSSSFTLCENCIFWLNNCCNFT